MNILSDEQEYELIRILKRFVESTLVRCMEDASYVADLSLYGGIGGQLLAIANSGAHEDDVWVKEMSCRYASLCLTEGCTTLGLLDGLAGRLYVLCLLQSQIGGLQRYISEYVSKNTNGFLETPRWELSAGSSGALLALGLAAEMAGSTRAEDLAEVILLDLLQNALCSRKHGVIWDIHPYQTAPLLSFAHGASGICYVLKSIARSTPSPALLDMVKMAFEYEDRLILAYRGRCPDFRVFDKDVSSVGTHYPEQMNAWCHGLPGLYVARAFPYSNIAGDIVINTSRNAAEYWRLGNLTLCHGDLGNAIIVAAIRGSQYARDLWLPRCQPDLRDNVESILNGGRAGVGNRWSDEMHGLFIGAAGLLHSHSVLKQQRIPDGVLLPSCPKSWPSMPWLQGLRGECVGRSGSVVFLDSSGNVVQIQRVLEDKLQCLNSQVKRRKEGEREYHRGCVMMHSARVDPVSRLLVRTTNQVELRSILEDFIVQIDSIDVLNELWVVSPLVEVEKDRETWIAVATLGTDGPMRLAASKSLRRILSHLPCRGNEIAEILEREEAPSRSHVAGSDTIMRLAHAGLIVTTSCSDRLSSMLGVRK